MRTIWRTSLLQIRDAGLELKGATGGRDEARGPSAWRGVWGKKELSRRRSLSGGDGERGSGTLCKAKKGGGRERKTNRERDCSMPKGRKGNSSTGTGTGTLRGYLDLISRPELKLNGSFSWDGDRDLCCSGDDITDPVKAGYRSKSFTHRKEVLITRRRLAESVLAETIGFWRWGSFLPSSLGRGA